MDHEIFSPIIFPKVRVRDENFKTHQLTSFFKVPRHHSDNSRRIEADNSPDVPAAVGLPNMQQNYPDMQSSLPPIFKPEIYDIKSINDRLKKAHPKNE